MYKMIYSATKSDVRKNGEVLTFPTVWEADFYARFYNMTEFVRVVTAS